MRIAPSEQAPARPELRTPEPRASFAGLLGVPDSPTASPGLDRLVVQIGKSPEPPTAPSSLPDDADSDGASRVAAATFDAFGMFGRVGATPLDGTPISKAWAVEASPIEGTPAPEAALRASASTPTSFAGLATSASAHRHGGPSEAFQTVRRSAQAADLSIAEGITVQDAPAADEGEAGPLAARRTAGRKSAEPETRARLTLSDTADAAGLAVRLVGLSAEEVAQFRARARTLLGEHGLRLEKLNINGEDRSASDLPTWGMKEWR